MENHPLVQYTAKLWGAVTTAGDGIQVAGEDIESKSIMTINNGTIVAKTADEGLNAGTFIYTNGGNIYAYSTSNDAIDSNEKITVTGGKVVAVGAGAPEEGFDCDRNTFKITGEILVGVAGARIHERHLHPRNKINHIYNEQHGHQVWRKCRVLVMFILQPLLCSCHLRHFPERL